MHKKILVAALVATGLFSGIAQAADEGAFLVRARAVHIGFDNGQADGLGGATVVEAKDRWIPEVDLSYFFTKNIAAELVLTYPQKIDIKLNGGQLGTIKALPPSLLLQYHFTDLGAFKPYVGAGLNYTIFTDRKNIGATADVDSSSWGLAAQVGFDYLIDKNWSVNLDVKYIQMSTDVHLTGGGAKLGKVDLNPITAGVGVGYRF
ncbi:OmpW/AlkL family protein [Quatrionicoccus australiensis]|uniref:OmpW/AlkL family protein n=1 Tax=Quatrionicoccus australiensis TaxID=138118 RepID=UPI001CF7F0C0|nr:OmpW family outer membrane protein [Quatrionicoccus australiensis]UCV14471.1 OmpW family protein [Quatrionicoccus australiensis]